jgi:hypothetical protein
MNQTCSLIRPPVYRTSWQAPGSLAVVLIVLLLIGSPLQSLTQENEYLRIYAMIEQADDLAAKKQPDKALAKYREAQSALKEFKISQPRWNSDMVAYRLNYLNDQILALTEKSAATDVQPRTRSASESGSVQLTLLEPGAEPRKALRLRPKPGDKQALALAIDMNVEVKMGDVTAQSMKMPQMKITMETAVQSVATNGDISFETVVGEVEVVPDSQTAPQIVEAMKTSVAGLKGISGAGTISSRGLSKGIDIKPPTSTDPGAQQATEQMKEALSRMVSTLPEEAVGPGAKWAVKMPINSQGMLIQQEARYELISVEEDVLTLTSTVTQNAANQKIENAMMPGLKMDLTKMVGQATSNTKVDLTKLMPVEGTMSSDSDVSMSMQAGGQKQAINSKIQMRMRLESK